MYAFFYDLLDKFIFQAALLLRQYCRLKNQVTTITGRLNPVSDGLKLYCAFTAATSAADTWPPALPKLFNT